jgi:phosphate transport system permease protein
MSAAPLLMPPGPTRPTADPRQLRPGREALVRPVAIFGAAAALTGLAFLVTPLSGAFGYAICTYLTFVALFAWDTVRREGRTAGWDRVITVVVTTCGLCTIVPLAIIVLYVVTKGIAGLSGNFFRQSMASVGPLDPASQGGAYHAIIGTLEQVGLASLIATPLGLLTAVYLSEAEGMARPGKTARLSRTVRLLVDAMSGIPSIVAGLFIYTMFIIRLHQGYSGLAAALALSVLMLPTVARTGEEVLRIVPGGLREASLSLGAPLWRTVLKVLMPAARSGLITAVILGVARIAGETAPLLMTALGSDAVNKNPFHGVQSALPLFAFQRIRNAAPSEISRGWAGALVLIALVLTLFTLARVLGSLKRKGA